MGSESRIKRNFKVIASLIAGVLLGVIMFSFFYVTIEADHDCAGEDCQICICIEKCSQILKYTGSGVVSNIAAVSLAAYLIERVFANELFVRQQTPVSAKVQLNN
ncbi:MAG: hypothetical protein K6F79_00585 [Saccharofermentans sp.]|nr:hypothetical protein [Saccharofermentans sp.]